MTGYFIFFFFFKQKTAYEIQGDWSSDVCSSDLVERLLGSGIVFQSVGRVELLRHCRFLFVCQMIQHVAALVDLAPLDRRRFTGVLFHCRSQSLAAVQNIEAWFGEIQPRLSKSLSNSLTTVAFSVAPCRMPKIVFRPSWDRKSTRLNSSHLVISYA